MAEKKVAYKTVEKVVKDKRTKEQVVKKFVYVDMERASQSEKELIQMLVSSGYEVKKWDSVKKTTGITAEVMYQYFKEKIKIAKANKEEAGAFESAKEQLVADIKNNVNFMTILRNFSKNYVNTVEDKQYLESLFIDQETIKSIGALKVAKVKQRKIRENDKKLSNQARQTVKTDEANAKMTKETTVAEESENNQTAVEKENTNK